MEKAKRFNAGKTRHSIIPTEILDGLARVYMMGAGKYGRDNWRSGEGLSWTETYDASQRHALAWLAGGRLDAESGLPHLLHAAWGLINLYYYSFHEEQFGGKDDRFVSRETKVVKPEVPNFSPVGGGWAAKLDASEKLRADLDAPSMDISALQREIAEWADGVFPQRTARGALVKLMLEEIPELLQSGHCDPKEFADVVILVLDIAHLQGIDIGEAVRGKMTTNKARKWKIDPETGLMNHIKKEPWND